MNLTANNLREFGRDPSLLKPPNENSALTDTLIAACETLTEVPVKPCPDF